MEGVDVETTETDADLDAALGAVRGHKRGCPRPGLPDARELKLGTVGRCPGCSVAFVVSRQAGRRVVMTWTRLEDPVDPVQGALELDTVVSSAVVVYRLVLPGVPPSKNQFDGLPPAWRNGQKRTWMRRVILACEEQNVPKGNQKVGLSARLVFGGHAPRRDPQNYASQLWNWVPDALVRGGYLVDDHDGRIEFGSNLGIQMAEDLRSGPAKSRARTIVSLAVARAVPKGST